LETVMHAVVPSRWDFDPPGGITVTLRRDGHPETEAVRDALARGERSFLLCAEGVAAEPCWVVATDHISLFGDGPLTGPNRDDLGERFPTLTGIYRAPEGSWKRGVVCRVPDWRSATRAEMDFTGAAAMVGSGVEEAVAAGHGGAEVVLLVSCHGLDGTGPGPAPLDELLRSLADGAYDTPCGADRRGGEE
jgi:hypothetical protein